MTTTPWGDASTLRERRLAPGRGTPRGVVRQNQRERLFAAMVAVTAEKGYHETAVADLVELSGVSSRSFYELFRDKEDCFLAALEEILAALEATTAAQLGGRGTMEERVERTVAALTRGVVAQPAAARFWLVEALCAGERARRRVDGALGEMAELLQEVYEGLPGRLDMPVELTRAILGGIVGMLYRRLARGEAEAIPELAPAMREWVLSIPPPARPLRPRGRRGRVGGGGSPPFVAHVPGERILRGFAAVVAEKGYAGTTIADIAAAAQISQNTFYGHFADKRDALAAALDSSGAQMVAATLPAVRRAPQWPGAVRVALEALCGFLAAEPAFAHLREVEVFRVGAWAVEQRDQAGAEILEMLAKLVVGPPALSAAASEATLAAIQSLLYERVRGGRPAQVIDAAPTATYIALAPTLGPEEAWAAAVG